MAPRPAATPPSTPDLGTLDDFDRFVAAARAGIEVALDLALQCSPDHPWVTEHPEWFKHRPDGSIRYAENPPKQYQDIYPLDFENEDWAALWQEVRHVVGTGSTTACTSFASTIRTPSLPLSGSG